MSRRRARCMRWCCARRTRTRASASAISARVRAMPGVRLVLTAARHRRSRRPADAGRASPDVDIKCRPIRSWRATRSRHVGDAVAFVVADTLDAGERRRRGDRIDWQPLPHVIGAVSRARSQARRRSGRIGRAISPSRPRSATRPRRKAAFAKAARTVELKVVNQRLVTNYLDTRGVVAEYDGDALSR